MTPAERRAGLTGTALELFAAKGYQGTSMGEIAEAAGVNRSVLYDRFPSKRVLFLTVLQEQYAALLARLADVPGDTAAPRDRVRAAIDAYLGFAEDRPAGRLLLFDLAGEDDPEIAVARWGIREARTRSVALLLRADLARTGVAPASADAAIRVEMLLAGLDGIARWREHRPAMSRGELVEIAMTVFWSGVGRTTP